METGSEPNTQSEIADLDAITALKESAALELKVFSFSMHMYFCVFIENENVFVFFENRKQFRNEFLKWVSQ